MYQLKLLWAMALFLSLVGGPARAWDPVEDLTGKPIHEHGEKLARETGNAVRDVAREAERLGRKTIKEIGNAGEDLRILVEQGRCGGDVCDALNASVKMVEANIVDLGVTIESAAERFREGKILDALWHLTVDPIDHQQENAAQAALESSVLRAVGQVAAGAYGGPQGTAAYAAWLAYHATDGDLEASLKAGAIAGVTAAAMGEISDVEGIDALKGVKIDAVVQRAALSGAVAGTAAAAAGGDEQAIKDAVATGFTMAVIRDGYKELTTTRLEDNLKASTGEPYCLGADPQLNLPDAERLPCLPPKRAYFDENGKVKLRNGKPMVDVSQLDAKRPHVGIFAKSVEDAGLFTEAGEDGAAFTESTQFMQGVSKVPGMNAMAVGHDIIDSEWNRLADIPIANDAFVVLESAVRVGSIAPSVVLTYEGAGFRVQEMIRDEVAARSTAAEIDEDGAAPRADPETSATPASTATEAEAFGRSIRPDAPAFEIRNLVCLAEDSATTALLEARLDTSTAGEGGRICEVHQSTAVGWQSIWHAHHDAGSCARALNRLAARALARGERCFFSTGLRYGEPHDADNAAMGR